MTRNMESSENSGRIQGEFTLNSWRIHAEFSTLRLAANEITARRQRDYGSFATTLRLAVTLLLMMVVGVSELRSQTAAPVGYDFSGVYYIANHNRKGTSGYDGYNSSDITKNFYLRPSSDTYDVDGEQPFLTTKKDRTSETPNPDIAKWTIIFAKTEGSTDYYYLKHNSNRYLTWHDPMSISGANSTDRVRLHLQSTLNEEKALFYFTKGNKEDNDYNICLKGVNCSKNTPGSLNPAKDNKDNEAGVSISGAGTVTVGSKTIQCGGLIGIYEQNDATGVWYLEDYIQRPAISYSGSSRIEITNNVTGATVYYTTDGTDPKNSETSFTGTSTVLPSFTDGTVIKAVSKIGEEYSNVATFTAYVHVGNSNPYVIQTVDGGSFYLVPPITTETYVTTTNIPHEKMAWYFMDAGQSNGVQYHYIVNNSTNEYLYCSGGKSAANAFVMKAPNADDTESTRYRFMFVPSGEGLCVIPEKFATETKGMCMSKKNGNNATDYLNLSNGTDNYSRWMFIARPDNPKTLFDNSFASSSTDSKYYKIQNANSTHNIIPPTTAGGNATTKDNATGDNTMWYFVPTADGDSWVEYYNIRNGLTGEYLYFNGTAGDNNTVFTSSSIITGNENQYKFIVVKGASSDYPNAYNIIPYALKDQANQENNSLNRNNNIILRTQNSRNTPASLWNLVDGEYTVAPPCITYDPATNTASITCTTPDAEISYATNLSEETSSISVPYITDVLTEGITTITATATKSETSNQTTYNVLIQTTVDDANKRPYLIQSQNNGWTTGEHQGFHYYMVPGETVEGNMYANTTTVFKPSMQWYFKYAEKADDGTVYYYIVNNDNGRYMYFHNVAETGYANGSIYLKESSEFSSSSDNNYKFFIRKQSNGYNIVPKLEAPSDNKLTNVHKGNNNNSNSAITLDNGATKANSLWKFILKSDLDQEAPFSASTENATYYYKIHNGVTSNHYITPPATTGGKVVMSDSSDETVQKSMNWYLEKIEDATDTDWLTYYVIRNAVTGDYLYYNYDDNSTPVTPVTTGSDECFEMKSDYDASKKGHYLFTWARTYSADRYYIVPQILKDYSLNNISSLRRSNKKLNIDVTRNSEAAIWQFIASDLFCNSPVFEEADGTITLSCNTNASEIRYTTNGEDPTATGVSYSTYSPSQPFSSSDKMVIKACAVVSDGTTTATSDIAILLNKPDITLEEGTFTYKGSAWEPTVTKVSINETEAPATPATYSVTYSNNTNARLSTDSNPPTVILDDADPNDSWYIWNGSKTFTIAQKELTITADSDTKEYDGTPLTKDSYTSKDNSASPGLAEGDSFKSVTISGSQTDVGSSANVPSNAAIKNASDEDMTDNYNISYENGTLEVTPKVIGDGNNPASDIDVSIGAGNAIILTYGDITLTEGSENDYTVGDETSSASGRYSLRMVTANEGGNYTGSFKARNAIVNFQTDDNAVEWSATFVAENAAGTDSNNSDNGHALPDGIMAYVITDIIGDVAVAEALNYIPEGIPVLLLSNAESGGFFVKDASGQTAITTEQTNSNMLEVTDESQHFDVRTIYLLYQNEFVYNMAGELAKGKVYLNPNHVGGGSLPAPSRLKIRINTEAGTGIDSVTEEAIQDTKKDSWYTLDGRCLNGKPQRRGLYITREKKVIVR